MFDLILHGGTVVDPAQGLNAALDVAIADGRIAALGPDLTAAGAVRLIDVSGKIVTPGLIDSHAHLCPSVSRHILEGYGMDADWVGVGSGVTTLVEMGGFSAELLRAHRRRELDARTNHIFAFLSPYHGVPGSGSLTRQFVPDSIDVDLSLEVIEESRDIVKGLKFWAEQATLLRDGRASWDKVLHIAREAKLPIYVHVGEMSPVSEEVGRAFPPERMLEAVFDDLVPGDILAHPYTREAGGYFESDGTLRPLAREAVARGIKLDLGYGTSTALRLARRGVEQGFIPDTLGGDIHSHNTRLPSSDGRDQTWSEVDNMPGVVSGMNLFLALGLPLEQVVAMATANPARIFLREEDRFGSLRPGVAADVTVLDDERGRWRINDTSGDHLVIERLLRPAFCLIGGRQHAADSPILRAPERLAA